MDRTARKIRRAFENITPNVLNRVIAQSYHEKGVVIPMNEKKTFIPFVLQRIASGAALIALVIAIGYVGLMILGGRTGLQLGENPTEPPTEELFPVSIEVTLNAAKLDKEGNELGTVQMILHTTKTGDNTVTDIEIDPFDCWMGLALPVDSTTGEKFKIQKVSGTVLNVATLGGFYTDNLHSFCTLLFTDGFTHLVLYVPERAGGYYYVAAAGNYLTAGEILDHFRSLGVTILSEKQ